MAASSGGQFTKIKSHSFNLTENEVSTFWKQYEFDQCDTYIPSEDMNEAVFKIYSFTNVYLFKPLNVLERHVRNM